MPLHKITRYRCSSFGNFEQSIQVSENGINRNAEHAPPKANRTKVILLRMMFCTAGLSFLFSCIGSRELMNETPDNQDMISVNAINGTYLNQSPSDTLMRTLWDILYDSYSFQEDTNKQIKPNTMISLSLNQKSLVVLAKNGDQIIGELELKGKIKGDYFCAKRNLFLVPIPFLFFRQRERRLVMGVTSENQLMVNHGMIEFAWVIMMAGGNDFNSTERYEKEK